MEKLAIGIAIMWLMALISRQKVSIQGIPSILFMLFIAWGLGSLVMLPFGR